MRRLRRSVERASTRKGILRRLVAPTLGVGLLVASSTPALAEATDKDDGRTWFTWAWSAPA